MAIPRRSVNHSYFIKRPRVRKAESYDGFEQDLCSLATDVLKATVGTDLIFVGRSPESLFDFLSGVLSKESRSQELTLLQFSARQSPKQIDKQVPGALKSLEKYFQALELTPGQIGERERLLSFVDFVCSGNTMGKLVKILKQWTYQNGLDWQQVQSSIQWISLIECWHPHYIPWHPRQSRWTHEFASWSIQTIPVHWRMWRYMAETQLKCTDSFVPEKWSQDPATSSSTDHSQAIQMARDLFRLGQRWGRRVLIES